MSNTEQDKKEAHEQNKNAAVKPDKETLHTTDPQNHMEGPVSSLMQNIKDSGKDDESKESADAKKDKNM